MLGLGKREPVRQLKKTGGVLKLLQQVLYTHQDGKYTTGSNNSLLQKLNGLPGFIFILI